MLKVQVAWDEVSCVRMRGRVGLMKVFAVGESVRDLELVKAEW